jgi:hypothetical protein
MTQRNREGTRRFALIAVAMSVALPLMLDRNSDQIAEVIRKWLVSRNLSD